MRARTSLKGRRAVAVSLLVAAVGFLAVGFIAFRSQHGSQPSPGDLVRLASPITYPAGSMVCSGAMTPACAHRAAVRAGHRVPWLAPPGGFTTDGVHVISVKDGKGTSLFLEELHSASALVDLEFGQSSNAVGTSDGTAPAGAATATISHHLDFGAGGGGTFDYYADWTVDGHMARLGVSSQRSWGSSPETTLKLLTDLLSGMQVASPLP